MLLVSETDLVNSYLHISRRVSVSCVETSRTHIVSAFLWHTGRHKNTRQSSRLPEMHHGSSSCRVFSELWRAARKRGCMTDLWPGCSRCPVCKMALRPSTSGTELYEEELCYGTYAPFRASHCSAKTFAKTLHCLALNRYWGQETLAKTLHCLALNWYLGQETLHIG
jgi:hypothetical protein